MIVSRLLCRLLSIVALLGVGAVACSPAPTPAVTPLVLLETATPTTGTAESSTERTEQATVQTNSSADDPRAEAVLAFLNAKVAGDRDTLSGLICAAMEAELDAQAMSFAGYGAQLVDPVCAVEAGSDLVACTGRITADYNGEARTFPLTRYQVVEESGVWKWCGEG